MTNCGGRLTAPVPPSRPEVIPFCQPSPLCSQLCQSLALHIFTFEVMNIEYKCTHQSGTVCHFFPKPASCSMLRIWLLRFSILDAICLSFLQSLIWKAPISRHIGTERVFSIFLMLGPVLLRLVVVSPTSFLAMKLAVVCSGWPLRRSRKRWLFLVTCLISIWTRPTPIGGASSLLLSRSNKWAAPLECGMDDYGRL